EPENKLTRLAMQLLNETSGVQAKILRLTFELEVPPLVGGKQGVVPIERAAKELRDEIDATPSAGELFQLGADRLGQIALEACNQGEGLRRFKAILEARTRSLSGETGVWLRPPEKLAVYQMYRALAGVTGPYAAFGSELLDKCGGFRERF